MSESLPCFKAYDVRGRVPDEINEDVARRIGRAYAEVIDPGSVVVGHDIRLTSESIKGALVDGLRDSGVNVVDIGLCGTEEIYFATDHLGVGGGIVVTASHNPKDYNGMKFVREGAKPISGDSGLAEIRRLTEQHLGRDSTSKGSYETASTLSPYIQHLLSYVDVANLAPLSIVCNAGNGGAGRVINALEPELPFKFSKVHHEANGHFPNGVPNPLLEENREATASVVRASSADLGIAWDGDLTAVSFLQPKVILLRATILLGYWPRRFWRSRALNVWCTTRD